MTNDDGYNLYCYLKTLYNKSNTQMRGVIAIVDELKTHKNPLEVARAMLFLGQYLSSDIIQLLEKELKDGEVRFES